MKLSRIALLLDYVYDAPQASDDLSASGEPIRYCITDRDVRVLRCDGFEFKARVVISAELSLYDMSAPRVIEGRKQKAGDSKREVFKP